MNFFCEKHFETFCRFPGLNLNYSILFFVIIHSLKALISNLFRLPLHNKKLFMVLKYCAVTKNWKVLSKHSYDDRITLMWTLCKYETNEDLFLALHPATTYTGHRSVNPPGAMLSSTCTMCSYATFYMGLCIVQTLLCFSLFGFPYLIIRLPRLWSYSH